MATGDKMCLPEYLYNIGNDMNCVWLLMSGMRPRSFFDYHTFDFLKAGHGWYLNHWAMINMLRHMIRKKQWVDNRAKKYIPPARSLVWIQVFKKSIISSDNNNKESFWHYVKSMWQDKYISRISTLTSSDGTIASKPSEKAEILNKYFKSASQLKIWAISLIRGYPLIHLSQRLISLSRG